MKKTGQLMVLFMLFLCSMLMAEFQEPILQSKDIALGKVQLQNERLDAPDVEFVTEPIEIGPINYYDYFPGGYQHSPLIIQPETTSSGLQAGGLYLVFHARESTTAQRKIYYAYLTSNGELLQTSSLTTDNDWEGFPGIDVDPITGNPLVAYHLVSDNNYDCKMSYDLFHIHGMPGNWKIPFSVMENNEDDYIWPKVVIGPSPIEGKRRVYICSRNITANPEGNTFNNIIIGKADFDGDLMAAQMELDFEYTTIPELDDLHYNNVARIISDIVVSDDGQVAIIGWYDTTFFTAISDDYGETYSFLETNGRFDYPPVHDNEGNPYWEYGELFAYPSGDGGHFNAIFNDNNQIIAFSAMGINTQANHDSGSYLPTYFYPKMFQFEIINSDLEVQIIDIQLEGNYPNDGFPAPPWDLNEDGIADSINAEGELIIPLTYPSHFFDGDFQDAYFHESNFKLSYKDNWFVAVWQDCENHYYDYCEPPTFHEWEEKPEIMVAVSGDYGITWSDPAKMNAKVDDANYYSQFNDMIPAYVYPADKLEVINSTTAKLHLFFMDDYSYGSFAGPTGSGENIGGMQYYTALSVDMPEPIVSAQQSEIPPAMHDLHLSNFPNPFNPSTTIQFELAEAAEATLEIFNVKGQRVKQFKMKNVKCKMNEVVWDGKDDNNQPVSSGIYFCKLRSSKYSAYRKMILMK